MLLKPLFGFLFGLRFCSLGGITLKDEFLEWMNWCCSMFESRFGFSYLGLELGFEGSFVKSIVL